jgi:hypothetical protein
VDDRELAQAIRVRVRLEGEALRRRTAEAAAAKRAAVKFYPPPIGVLSTEPDETQADHT